MDNLTYVFVISYLIALGFIAGIFSRDWYIFKKNYPNKKIGNITIIVQLFLAIIPVVNVISMLVILLIKVFELRDIYEV